MLKSQIPMARVGRWVGGQLLTCAGWVGGGGGVGGQLLMQSPKMLKSQILMSRVGRWVGREGKGCWQSTFDVKSNNA